MKNARALFFMLLLTCEAKAGLNTGMSIYPGGIMPGNSFGSPEAMTPPENTRISMAAQELKAGDSTLAAGTREAGGTSLQPSRSIKNLLASNPPLKRISEVDEDTLKSSDFIKKTPTEKDIEARIGIPSSAPTAPMSSAPSPTTATDNFLMQTIKSQPIQTSARNPFQTNTY